MLVQLRIREEGSEWLESLFLWLEEDPRLGSGSSVAMRAVPSPGSQGGAFDVINAVLGDGIGIGGLALSYASWRRANPKAPEVTVERDGTKITVIDGSEEAIQRIITLAGDPKANEDAGS